MLFTQLAAVYRTMSPRAVFLVAISASLLCAIYLFRLTHPHTVTWSVTTEKHSKPISTTIIDDVFNRTLGFEKIFVISLPERSDRRDSIILSAALSNIDIEIVDAVRGDAVPDKVIPHPEVGRFMKAEIGCWRSHMNVMQQIIQRNLSSVLIIEDDSDWDVRIGEQLRDFAHAAQALQQPLSASSHEGAPRGDELRHSRRADPASKGYEISFDNLPQTIPAKHSPYGDKWDHLWLGHCGVTYPPAKEGKAPVDRVVQAMDLTVPQKSFLTNNLVGNDLGEYPDHTRVVHRSWNGLCTSAYAITQAGARSLMASVGVKKMTTIDFGLREWCDGTNGRDSHQCFATQPALFQPHRKAGSQTGDSDIDTAAHGTGIRTKAMTEVVRWSTILNWDVLLAGGKSFVDQYPDKA